MEHPLLLPIGMHDLRWRWWAGVAALAMVSGAAPAWSAQLVPAGSVVLPGRGMAVSWSADGKHIAMGGHFRDSASSMRYDTRVVDVGGKALLKAFDCHYWWVVSTAWQHNPYLGSVIADGAGDHTVRLWNGGAAGSTTCSSRGQARSNEGSIKVLQNVNGWTTSLAFSPDGRWLASTSRDKAVRIWQLFPGANQFKVVRLWYDGGAGNQTSVRWSRDGGRLLVADRTGHVSEWTFDPAKDLWDAAMIADYNKLGFSGQPSWFTSHAAVLAPKPLWKESGHKQVWNARYDATGTRVMFGGGDGTVAMLEAVTGKVLWRMITPKGTPVYGLDVSPDGALVAAGAKDKNIYLHDATTGKLLQTVSGSGDGVTAVAWSPDGKTLASVAGGQLINLTTNDLCEGPDVSVRFWARQ